MCVYTLDCAESGRENHKLKTYAVSSWNFKFFKSIRWFEYQIPDYKSKIITEKNVFFLQTLISIYNLLTNSFISELSFYFFFFDQSLFGLYKTIYYFHYAVSIVKLAWDIIVKVRKEDKKAECISDRLQISVVIHRFSVEMIFKMCTDSWIYIQYRRHCKISTYNSRSKWYSNLSNHRCHINVLVIWLGREKKKFLWPIYTAAGFLFFVKYTLIEDNAQLFYRI